jgi:hypothetical protein
MMNKIIIANILNSKSAVLHDEGLLLFKMLNSSISQNKSIQLSFEGLEDCTTAFLNASIGNLYIKHNLETITTLLSFEGIENQSLLKTKIDRVIQNASDPKKREIHDDIIHEALSL